LPRITGKLLWLAVRFNGAWSLLALSFSRTTDDHSGLRCLLVNKYLILYLLSALLEGISSCLALDFANRGAQNALALGTLPLQMAGLKYKPRPAVQAPIPLPII